jgi:hypothetical protein
VRVCGGVREGVSVRVCEGVPESESVRVCEGVRESERVCCVGCACGGDQDIADTLVWTPLTET